MAQKTRNELLHDVEDLRVERDRLHAQLEALKRDVREKAKEVADEQGWCLEGVNSVLDELGLEPYHNEYQVVFEARVYFTVNTSTASGGDELEVDEEWVRQQIAAHMNYEHMAAWSGGEWTFEDEEILSVTVKPTEP